MKQTRQIERTLGDAMRRHLPHALAELVMFALKQGWACLFGGLMLAALIGTSAIWQHDWPVARYDALVVFAVALQSTLLALRLETWREVRVIALFHLTGTIMEIFKVDAGSWAYPEPGILKIMGVPLFSGFMYAAVGSYTARVIRIFDMRFAPYPPCAWTVWLALAIYANFFTHHWLPDARLVLFAATILIFARTRIWFRIGANFYWMPLPFAALLTSVVLWIAENVGTHTGTWVYGGPNMVSLAKIGSWYLLLYVSFTTVVLVYRDALESPKRSPATTNNRSPCLKSEADSMR